MQAVLFDLGGVVLESPFRAIAEFEQQSGIAPGSVNSVITASGAHGAWARLERGEISSSAFYELFEQEAEALGVRLSARALLERLHARMQPRPLMLRAIARIRERGLRTGAVTNNWVEVSGRTQSLREYFDVFVESARVGLRKPDPRIYELACKELDVPYTQTVFLDDIGANLKTARALGMYTIKVVDPNQALLELEGILGFSVQ